MLKPQVGVSGQLVIFDFGSFYMLRCLAVHVVSEHDRRLLPANRRTVTKPGKV